MFKINQVISIISFVLCISIGYGQVSTHKQEKFQLNFEKPVNTFIIPSIISKPIRFEKCYYPIESRHSLVFKSPVHYTAFFCKLEVRTMNALGIMLKLHAGDYDSYSGEGRFVWHQP